MVMTKADIIAEYNQMIVETAALDTIRQFLANKDVTWEDFLVFTSGVVDLTTAVGKRCG